MKKIISLFLCIIFVVMHSNAQDSLFARKMVDTLCSTAFWGRGYTKNGMQNAADFLKNKFIEFGIEPLHKNNYFQDYSYNVNTFPNKMEVSINGKKLRPGVDFIVQASSKGNKCNGNLERLDNNNSSFIDPSNQVLFTLKNKLTMTVASTENNYTEVELLKPNIDTNIVHYSIDIDNKFIKKFKAKNICGIVKGTQYADSILFITAHYDHLGGLGEETYFAGANDNASGVALLLNLAKYYVQNPQPYSIGFILFSGEEAGLLGSKYFIDNPLVDLKKIKFLLNTDLAGTGVDGITVCNATIYEEQFKKLQDINNELHLLRSINARGKAANSDHYWFSEKNVPCFFFYTLGGISAYHDVFDIASTLPLTKHEDLFKLVVEFNKRLMKN